MRDAASVAAYPKSHLSEGNIAALQRRPWYVLVCFDNRSDEEEAVTLGFSVIRLLSS